MELKTWEPHSLDQNFSSLVCGSRRSGKSFLVQYLWKNNLSSVGFDIVIVMSTEENKDFYFEFLPEDSIYKVGLSSECFEELKEIQDEAILKHGDMFKCLIVLDDLISAENKNNAELIEQFVRGRHLNCSIIVLTQYLNMISSTIRENLDFVFILKIKSGLARTSVIENYLLDTIEFPEGTKEKKQFAKLLNEKTNDHGILVIDYLCSGDSLYYYRC